MANTYPENPTPEDIEGWKNKYGDVFCIKFPEEYEWVDNPEYDPERTPQEGDTDETNPMQIKKVISPEVKCYLRPPDRKTLAAAQMVASVGSDIRFNETIINTCWLGGNPIIKTQDKYFLGAGRYVNQMIDIKEAELEKL